MKLRIKWKSLAAATANYWSLIFLGMIGFTIIGFLLGYKLGTLTPAFSQEEIINRNQSASFQSLSTNPLYAPQSSLQYSLQNLGHKGPLAMRSVSALLGVLVIVGFYYVLSKWYTIRIALLGTLLLVTSSWYLHTTRLAANDVTFMLVILLLACGSWVHRSRINLLTISVSALIVIGLLYIPGMVWFVLPLLIWQKKRIGRAIKSLAVWQLVVIIIVSTIILGPLVWALVTQSRLYLIWLGLPADWPTIKQIVINLAHIPDQLFWHGPTNPTKGLVGLALLDWFSIIMIIVGLYAYRFKLHLDRTWFLIYIAITGTFLIAIGGPVKISLFLPFAYLLVASGIALMLQQWFTVFPRNPFARSLGAGLIILAVMGSSFYQLNQYFIAWPNTPDTRQSFIHQP